MKTRLFIIFSLVGSSIYALQSMGQPLPEWMNNHMNDILCMPIVLFVCQYLVRKIKSDRSISIPIYVGFLVTLYFSIYFEYFLPKFNPRYTGDVLDVIAYLFGWAFFHLMERLSSQNNKAD